MSLLTKIREGIDEARYYRGQRREWMSARSLPELGERGARWAAGKLGAHPGGYDVPAPETEALLPVIQRANEAGFFTYQSQPGGEWDTPDGHEEARAFVEGFLERSALEGFRRHMEGAGMLVLDSMAHDEPLVRYNGSDECGGRWRARADGSMNHISSAARASLASAADLTVIDTEWGRNDVLWPALDSWAASVKS